MKVGYIRVSTIEQNEARQEVLMEQLGVLSQITIICRPTKDPELQTDKYGTLYTRVDAAVNPLYK